MVWADERSIAVDISAERHMISYLDVNKDLIMLKDLHNLNCSMIKRRPFI